MTESDQTTPCNLPSKKLSSIQIGSELFRSQAPQLPVMVAPSYFSHFFEQQLRVIEPSKIRTLYIDRDPAIFHEIARHLQGIHGSLWAHRDTANFHTGYYVRPQDGAQFVEIFADAQFYTLPRLMSQLFESEIFIQVGDRHFQIPRDIFNSPGDSPNFFTLGFGAFFATPTEVFPGLSRVSLLRPPAITPPAVPNRFADVFTELLHLLRGYSLQDRNEIHRAELLRDCRYFHLRGLEQKLIPHQLAVNPFSQRSEITIRLGDVRPSGIRFAQDAALPSLSGPVMYTRPFIDDDAADLILEIGDESTLIHCASHRANFIGLAKSRMASLLQVVGKKLNLTVPDFGGLPIKIRFERETDLNINGESNVQRTERQMEPDMSEVLPAKRQRSKRSKSGSWIVRTGQWRLHVQMNGKDAYDAILIAVKLDVCTTPRIRNQARNFL
ncbi:hypothetical protein N7490_006554 [Penicillium lividum]|nr:hypothetical protein N7490_006554 [Penicillium lividum]